MPPGLLVLTLSACLWLAGSPAARAEGPPADDAKRPAAPAVDAAIHRALEHLKASQRRTAPGNRAVSGRRRR